LALETGELLEARLCQRPAEEVALKAMASSFAEKIPLIGGRPNTSRGEISCTFGILKMACCTPICDNRRQ
jgi:hypothetical protein